jgi:hypothetical protein
VRIDVPAALCAERLASRASGRNLSNDPSWAARFHTYWTAQVEPKWRFDLAVDGADAEAAVRAIAERLN